jgi:hypothetical protein
METLFLMGIFGLTLFGAALGIAGLVALAKAGNRR